MRVIGLDTSTATGGVALLEGDRLVGEYTLNLQRTTHAERLMPALERVMGDAGWDAAAGVDGIAVALGPGSFTGLRIGVVTAKALSYAWGAPLAGVPTLEAMAYQASGADGLLCPAIDARHGHVFCAAYRLEGGWPVQVLGAQLRAFDEWLDEVDSLATGERVVFVGDGVDAHWQAAVQRLGARAVRPPAGLRTLRSAAVAALGAWRLRQGRQDDPAALVPLYLRESEAERKWAAKHPSPSSSNR
ncbi:MAG: tRNA N6-adenosine(37)-N6-threonylcarbamoyltransferase complex dimerization subunit TsaB [Firmicutes bacterium ZCTH02-B6]|nr:MAG: tRNA N6-adenosine(37)-N6-threonylcarbamoyltransferase complex dimerization subunit TsaB [Firmicutes bacterium ZCTH02-B6]